MSKTFISHKEALERISDAFLISVGEPVYLVGAGYVYDVDALTDLVTRIKNLLSDASPNTQSAALPESKEKK